MIHVTEAIKLAGLIPEGPWFNDYAKSRGTAVHVATQFLDEDDLDWSDLDEAILPKVQQYQRFRRECPTAVLATEEEVENTELVYCGRVDRRLFINGTEGVLDIKPCPSVWHPLQTAAYAHCYDRPMARWCLYLSDTAYRLVPHDDENDWRVFRAALILANWKKGLQ